TVLRALGDSKTPMRFVLVAVLLNVVLDPLFIHTFGLGVRGAAFATVLSQGFAFFYGLTHVLRKKLVPLRAPTLPAWPEVRTILNLGIPSGLQMAVISGGSAAIMSVVTNFGGDVVGGFSAAQRLDSLIMLPAQALGISVSSMAGQNIGSRNWHRVGKIARVAVSYNLAIMLLIAIFMVVFAEQAIKLFVQEGDAASFGMNYLRSIALFYRFLALNLISFWLLRYPLTAIFAHLFGESGIAFGVGTSFVVSSAFAYLYYRFGKWQKKQLFEEPLTR